MHGWVQRDSESCRSLRRSSSQHMRSVLPSETTHNTVAVAGDNHSPPASSITTSPSGDSFFKDGRKISVGDCALFKPDKVSPPFIGLIRWLALNKENNLQLGVNWLYRSSELKLGKGHPVDSAPNEIFYSFHKDEIPAASLLHPCKVAFLHRGVELPPGASSFVCRRAYDIANKRLRWLTDQDYINEQQEVNQLLSKTGTEMHVTLQPGGRSPKQVNGPTSTSQLKPASDSGQNGGTSFPSQAKGKKRERGDHGADPVKRERSSSRTDDGDSVQCKTETNLKNEIARITDKGGVVDLEGVEKLVQLMQLDRKMDLLSRSMLASVMASTDEVDCLNHFVQLRGLRILDEWLQDIHKGKIGDGKDLKAGDEPVEEFLLVLLRALDKLPVNLQALVMCNIGRSVNHLQSHKNVEIQRKAGTVVDTWKKRVEAEMIGNHATSGSTHAAAAGDNHSPPASSITTSPSGDSFFKEQQEEVNQLLSKTETEMHGTLQPGGRSPKQINCLTSTSELKPASDSGQNGGTSFPTQAKGKKRERGDHDADPVKRERSSSRTDDGDSVQCKTETNLKNEIARITDKGGVVDLEGVEKLVQLMQLDRKMDLLSRYMLASVMASTDEVDCLNHFVQLSGLCILDEWLQDIHKGNIGDGNNLKAGDKPVEEFLLVLLRALDKLPVNLKALRMCNIGRSVNRLRSHKNVEIQRKARTLVETWKKRVEAEMIGNHATSGSTHAAAAWPSK